jgi:hypothetical protein
VVFWGRLFAGTIILNEIWRNIFKILCLIEVVQLSYNTTGFKLTEHWWFQDNICVRMNDRDG